MRFTPRKSLSHATPSWVASGSLYFVTINAAARRSSVLTEPRSVAEGLLESAAHYHHNNQWFVRLMLLMPDHLHALLAVPTDTAIQTTIGNWKRYTARSLKLDWQRDFFDHRLRSDESWQLKANYIRENPVRKGLVASPADWPWLFEG
jgi:putative transposase